MKIKVTKNPKAKAESKTQPNLVTKVSTKNEDTKVSTKSVDMKTIKENPENYMQVNIIKKNKMIETFYKYINKKTFTYWSKDYDIDSKGIILLPRKGYFIPAIFFREGHKNPVIFDNKNKGIPSRAMTLLYDLRLYRALIKLEEKNINIILIILNIVTLILLSVVIYCMYQIETYGFIAF